MWILVTSHDVLLGFAIPGKGSRGDVDFKLEQSTGKYREWLNRFEDLEDKFHSAFKNND